MSTNGLTNNSVNVNTIDGLTVLYASQIYENGNPIVVSNLVPYTNAVKLVDLNNQNLQNVNTLSTTNIIYTGLINSISPTILNYIANLSSDAQTQLNNIVSSLSNYLTIASAASTYLTIANASSTYLTQANASSTYLTIANASSTYQPLNSIVNAVGSGFDLAVGSTSNILTITKSTGASFSNDGGMLMFKQTYFPSNSIIATGGISGYQNTSGSFGGGLSFWYCPPSTSTLSRGMTLSQNGYLGIGILNPSYELHVVGYINTTQGLVLNGATTLTNTVLGYLNGVSSNIQTQFNTINTTLSTNVALLNASNTFTGAINTFNNQSYFNQINCNTIASQTAGDLGLYASGATNIRFYVNGSNLFTISSSGFNGISPTIISYLSGVSSNIQTQFNTINTTLSTNVALLNSSNIFTGAINTFGGTLANNQPCQVAICNNQSGGWIASSHTSTYSSATPDRVVLGWLGGYGAVVGCHNYNLSAWGTINIIGGDSSGIISRIYINNVGVYFERALNGITPTVFNYIANLSSDAQTQINTINSTISGLPTLSGANVWTGSNNFTNTAFYFAQINGNTIASNAGDLGLYASGATNIRFYVNGSNLFTINSSGLNNISPTVFGYLSGVSSDIQTQFNTINSTISGLPTLSANNIFTGSNRFPNINIGTGTAQQNNLVKIDNGTKCGISLGSATTSLRYIGITNSADGTDTGTNSMFSGIVFGGTNLGTASGNLIFYTADSATNTSEMRLVIERNGRFGFNVAIPSYTMDIVGDMRISGNALFQSQITATQLNCNTIASTSSSNNLELYSLSPAMNFILNGASNHHTISFGTGSSSLYNHPTSYQLQLNSQNSYIASSNSHTWYISNTPIMNLTTSSGDWLGWARLTNNPAINMGNNYLGYATSAGQWVAGSSANDMVLRTATNIRFTVNNGSSEVMSCQSNNVVVTGNVKGTSAIMLNLGSGSNSTGGATSLNNTNTLFGSGVFSSGDWGSGNFHVFTNSSSCATTTAGLGCWGGDNNCGIVALAPQVAWRNMYISGGNVYAYLTNVLGAYLTTGGWVNVSDERCKRDIKPLKTNRSLERVLAVKTYTYKRICKPTEHGDVDYKITEKNLVGFIAQEVQSSNPHCLDTWIDTDEKDEERFGINYNDYVVHLVGAVQEQNKTIQEQATTIKSLQTDITTLYNTLSQVINTLNSLTTNNISS